MWGRVPTVMENPGKKCYHGKSWKMIIFSKSHGKVMENGQDGIKSHEI